MKADDDLGFREFARAKTLALRRTAYLLCGDWHLAEDLVQTALFKLYRAWPRLSESQAVDNYARQVLLRCWVDEQRKPWRRRERRDGVVPDGEQAEIASGFSAVLLTALAGLPPRQRAAVVLRYCLDLPITEVAATLCCSEGTVKSQSARGLESLRTIVDRLETAERSLG